MAAPVDKRLGDEFGMLPQELGLQVPNCHNKATRNCETCSEYNKAVYQKFEEFKKKLDESRVELEKAQKSGANSEEIRQKTEIVDQNHELFASAGRYMMIITGQLK